MGDYAFQVTCDHTPSCKSGGPNPEDALFDVRNSSKAYWQKNYVKVALIECDVCGCEYDLALDGGGNVIQVDVSKPRIDSINVLLGPMAGGTLITVSGHRLNFGTVDVKIAGESCTGYQNASDGSLQCLTPAGDMSLEQEGFCTCRVDISNVTGTFQVGETVSQVGAPKSPEIIAINPGWLWLKGGARFFTYPGTITGDVSGATAQVDLFHQVIAGEGFTGETSGATAVLTSVQDLKPRVHQVSGMFQAGEWGASDTSQTRIVLKDPPLDGTADVEVSNDNGQRANGGKLVGGFTYTP